MSAAEDYWRPPALTERLLLAVLPESYRDAVAGDLEEAYATVADQGNSWQASWWYRKEVAIAMCHGARWRITDWLRKNASSTLTQEDSMLPVSTATNRPIAFALAVGVLGDATSFVLNIIIISLFPGHQASWLCGALLAVVGYGLPFLAIALYLRAERVSSFPQRLTLAFGAFTTMWVLQYSMAIVLSMSQSTHLPIQQLLAAITISLALGLVLSLVIAWLPGKYRTPATD